MDRILSPGAPEGKKDSLGVTVIVMQGGYVMEMTGVLTKGCLDHKLDETPEGEALLPTGQLASVPHCPGDSRRSL